MWDIVTAKSMDIALPDTIGKFLFPWLPKGPRVQLGKWILSACLVLMFILYHFWLTLAQDTVQGQGHFAWLQQMLWLKLWDESLWSLGLGGSKCIGSIIITSRSELKLGRHWTSLQSPIYGWMSCPHDSMSQSHGFRQFPLNDIWMWSLMVEKPLTVLQE